MSIPKAVREQLWLLHCGQVYQHKCLVSWCQNRMTVFDFECGHNIPQSKGGATHLSNLRPLCSRCNKGMGNHYTIDAWNALHAPQTWSVWFRQWISQYI